MKYTASTCFKPTRLIRLVSRENSKSRRKRGIIRYHRFIHRKIERIKGKWEVHYNGLKSGHTKVMHHFGRRYTGNRSGQETLRFYPRSFCS